jgi:hypothetical protein
MGRYEVSINILDESYVDRLIISLARQGYAPYYNPDERVVCFTADGGEVRKLEEE